MAKELEQAKEIEKAYKELEVSHTALKNTQAQLIQSEKMASLGELTAGIAHEIQNPLNFVNNFSELNNELINELKKFRKDICIRENVRVEDFINDSALERIASELSIDIEYYKNLNGLNKVLLSKYSFLLIQKIKNNSEQIIKLTELRDFLIPKLLSQDLIIQ